VLAGIIQPGRKGLGEYEENGHWPMKRGVSQKITSDHSGLGLGTTYGGTGGRRTHLKQRVGLKRP